MNSKTQLFCFGLGTLLVVGLTVLADKPVPPPSRAQVLGAWSGYTDHLDFLRLELDDDGTGFLCVGWVGDAKPDLYRVQAWRYSDWKVTLATQPIDKGAEPVYLTNIICGYEELKCEFGGTAGWHRKATLIGEREWIRRSKPLEHRIETIRREKK